MIQSSILALVTTRRQAEKIVDELSVAGFSMSHVSMLLPKDLVTREVALEETTRAPEGAFAGAGLGGTIGGTLGLLAGIGALAIPGLGPLLAVGPIVAALSGVAAGAAIGGLAGGLVGLGIPEVLALEYETKIKDGSILVCVRVEDAEQRSRARDVFQQCGALDIVVVAVEEGAPPTEPQHAAV